MNKGERGITLIALVVTIIVLIILAGVSIAALSGDTNIVKNAKLAKCMTAYNGAEGTINSAYSGVRTDIAVQAARDSSYDARYNENVDKFVKMLSQDMLEKDAPTANDKVQITPYYLTAAPTANTDVAYILVEYKDGAIEKGLMSEDGDTEVIPHYEGKAYALITLSRQTAKYEYGVLNGDDNTALKDSTKVSTTAGTYKKPTTTPTTPTTPEGDGSETGG